jgi:hypothetical protein
MRNREQKMIDAASAAHVARMMAAADREQAEAREDAISRDVLREMWLALAVAALAVVAGAVAHIF